METFATVVHDQNADNDRIPYERMSGHRVPLMAEDLDEENQRGERQQLIERDNDSDRQRLLINTNTQPSMGGSPKNAALVDGFDKENIDRQAVPCEEGQGTVCSVCYEEYLEEDFFSLKCKHSFCVNCTSDHLRINIESGNAMKLPCMQADCKERFKTEEIQQFCSAKIVK